MKAQALVTQNHGETARDTIKKLMEECEMKATNTITMLNNWLSQGWVRKTPGKLLGALAVGGLIMTAAVVSPGSAFADEPSRPLSIEASQGYGPIDDMAVVALLATDPSRVSKQDTRLYANGMDFVEENGVGKVSYTRPAECGHLCDLIALAELNSAKGGDYIFWADFPN